jgi:hypothetical protein
MILCVIEVGPLGQLTVLLTYWFLYDEHVDFPEEFAAPPASTSASITPARILGGKERASFCKPSLGPTSWISMWDAWFTDATDEGSPLQIPWSARPNRSWAASVRRGGHRAYTDRRRAMDYPSPAKDRMSSPKH